MKTFEQFGIRLQSGATGNIKAICPSCTPHNRKPKNRNSKDLSVNIPDGIWNCHNCGWKGSLKEKEEKTYTKPVVIELSMSEKAIGYFKGRGINENTLKFFGITEKMEWMPQVGKESNCLIFPYRKNGEWVNVKYRDGNKNFKLTKDAELILFNYDAIVGKKKIVITEGEIDCMSLHEVGFFECCSVPNGATKGNQRLDYLDNSWLAFQEADEVIIATDNDEAGIALKNELSRRLGKERCHTVNYPDGCKDFNEVLVKFGPAKVWEVLKSATPLPVEGVFRLSDFEKDLDNVFENGFTPGVTIGYRDFDGLLNFSEGQLTVVTGVPNSGKSAFLNQVFLRLAQNEKWNIGICSFEYQPATRHAANLASAFIGHPVYGKNKMSKTDYQLAKQFMQEYFFWFKMKDEDLTIDGILARARQLVKANGIKCLLIDPYNYIESKRKGSQTETEYVSELLSDICNFAKDYGVHVFLVAHPTKIKKNPVTKDFEVPNLYDISGSANFFNKPDNGLCVYRNRATNQVFVHIQKIRFIENGKIGCAEFKYDVHTCRYTEVSQTELQVDEQPPDNPRAGFQNYNPNQTHESTKNEPAPF